jgi:limonene-1,2-epoxide hydrolase
LRRRASPSPRQLVQDFVATWSAKDFDPDKVTQTYLADDASVRVLDSLPFVVGPAAVAAAFKPFIKNGERFKVKFLATFATGPIVVTHRIDTQVLAGKPVQTFEVVGVFLIKGRKIKEWTDYLVA